MKARFRFEEPNKNLRAATFGFNTRFSLYKTRVCAKLKLKIYRNRTFVFSFGYYKKQPQAEFYSRRKFVSGFFNFPAEVPAAGNLFNFPAKETAPGFLVTSFGPGTKEDSFFV